jgi:cystathionine beta-lyase
MVWIETPTNPLLKIIDIKAIANITREKNIMLAVDNTFASPYLQNPLDLGADLVMHSITKYLGGHSDVIMGCLMLNDEETAAKLKFIQFAVGSVPAPFDCFLVLRGIKTLHLRMREASKNARALAEALKNHPKIKHIYYPGLPEHPNHAVAAAQMRDFGGMLSFTLKEDTLDAARRFFAGLQIFSLAESLGGVESLANHPPSMTHASIPPAERAKLGITDSFVRLSVGVEDAQDLINDVLSALEKV